MSFFSLTAEQNKAWMFGYLFYVIEFFWDCLFESSACFFFFAWAICYEKNLKQQTFPII